MSSSNISIGDELKDSYKPTSKWVNRGIEWLFDIESFYKERAALEREHATKMKDLCKKHFEMKAKKSASISVGEEPQITPGSLECASMVLWNEVLTKTEGIAEEKIQMSRELNSKVCDNLALLKSRCDRISKQIEGVNEYVKTEKQQVEDEVKKAKKHYDSLCQATESARQKTEKSSSEKNQRKLEEKTVDMNIGKNQYIIQLNIANRLKDKYYYQDLPEILDYYQDLNECKVQLVNKILKNACIIERNSLDKIKEILHTIDSTIDQNKPNLDTIMFVKHNTIDWKEPQDFYFVPCDIWHDDESLVVKEPELTDLKKRLSKKSSDYNRYEDLCLSTKQRLEESVTERKKSESVTLKFDTMFSDSLGLLHKFIKDDTQRLKSEVEIETIQNFAGDHDLSYVETSQQKKSKLGFLRGKSNKNQEGGGDTQSLHTVKSTSTHQTSHSGIFNLRRNRAKSNASAASLTDGPYATALYQFNATANDELSVVPGDTLAIVEEDDGSGWTTVRHSSGQEGTVPTSYLQINRASVADSSNGKRKGPAVAPKRGAKKVQYLEALFDYQAADNDELSIKAGDRIVLIKDDDDGSGWTEGKMGNDVGMVPTSYVKKI